MALKDLLYRCPVCGRDPVSGAGDAVRCPGCGSRFRRAGEGAWIEVRAGGRTRLERPARLRSKLERLGGPRFAAWHPDGSVRYSAAAACAGSEDVPVRRRGRILGWREALGREVLGRLVAETEWLVFEPADGTSSWWSYLDLRGLQVSSRALQVVDVEDRMYQLRLVSDSPLRWETLLCELVSAAWRKAGRGRILEFQPRIVSEAVG